ncbi:MAG: chemotaxis protein CheB [Pseudomonadales bacterium]
MLLIVSKDNHRLSVMHQLCDDFNVPVKISNLRSGDVAGLTEIKIEAALVDVSDADDQIIDEAEILMDNGVPVVYSEARVEDLSEILQIAWRNDMGKLLKVEAYDFFFKNDSHSDEHVIKNHDVWLIGASSGGPKALAQMFAEIPHDAPFSVVLCQHINTPSLELLMVFINKGLKNWVSKAISDGDKLKTGVIFICPPGMNVSVSEQGKFRLAKSKGLNAYNPSIDENIASLMNSNNVNLGIVILSGMGNDSCLKVKEALKKSLPVYVQDSESCASASMPDAVRALEAGAITFTPLKIGMAIRSRYNMLMSDVKVPVIA